jgi:hypothetical protein
MSFQAIDLIGVDLYNVDASARFPLGQRVQALDSVYGVGEFMYVTSTQSNTANTWGVVEQDSQSFFRLIANAIGPVGITMAALGVGQFGWVQIYGKAIGKALAGFVDGGQCYATATGGSIDDAVVAGDRVKNARGASAVDAPAVGLAEFEIFYPFMDDGIAA